MPKKPTYHRRVADIVKRLPLHRSLDESQSMLVTLTPIWNRWLQSAVNNKKLPRQCATSTFMSAWQAEQSKLVISCDNASNASLIKHQSVQLITYLNRALNDLDANQLSSQLTSQLSPQPSPQPLNESGKQITENLPNSSTNRTRKKVLIKKIVVRLSLSPSDTASLYQDQSTSTSLFNVQSTVVDDSKKPALSASSLAALENCQTRTNNEALATALKNLTETLKNS